MKTHPLIGATVVDNATKLRGKILTVALDGRSVTVSFRRGSFCSITPDESGRYSVLVP
jgi:hypothetical protein